MTRRINKIIEVLDSQSKVTGYGLDVTYIDDNGVFDPKTRLEQASADDNGRAAQDIGGRPCRRDHGAQCTDRGHAGDDFGEGRYDPRRMRRSRDHRRERTQRSKSLVSALVETVKQ